jgi:hypothetical protein
MDDTAAAHGADFEDWLDRPWPPAGTEKLRRSLLDRTTRVLRRRRRVRQLSYIMALAVCYAAGLLTMRLGMGSPRVERPEMVQGPAGPAKPMAPPAPAPPSVPPSRLEPEAPALVLEWKAVDSREKRPDLYRRAGDRYLEEESDVESALRCYRGALDSGSEEDLTISEDDNWLLMALKEAKQKEKRHAHSGT